MVSFVGALRMLAASCQYGAFEEDMIRDQLVEKTNNKKVQESLLSNTDLTLSKALDIASRIESTTSSMEQMSLHTASVNMLHKGKHKSLSNVKQAKKQQLIQKKKSFIVIDVAMKII